MRIAAILIVLAACGGDEIVVHAPANAVVIIDGERASPRGDGAWTSSSSGTLTLVDAAGQSQYFAMFGTKPGDEIYLTGDAPSLPTDCTCERYSNIYDEVTHPTIAWSDPDAGAIDARYVRAPDTRIDGEHATSVDVRGTATPADALVVKCGAETWDDLRESIAVRIGEVCGVAGQ